jgi:hypothetical protein
MSRLAQSGHPLLQRTCPLLGVERTWSVAVQMSAGDPKRTLAFDSVRNYRFFDSPVFRGLSNSLPVNQTCHMKNISGTDTNIANET